jgi:hypothetical protein
VHLVDAAGAAVQQSHERHDRGRDAGRRDGDPRPRKSLDDLHRSRISAVTLGM